MFYWGTKNLVVLDNSYAPPYPQISITELELIPAGVESPASSIQTGSRGRKKAGMRLLMADISEYQVLYNDYLLSTARDIGLPDVPDFSAIIASMGLPTYRRSGWIECDIQFLEV